MRRYSSKTVSYFYRVSVSLLPLTRPSWGGGTLTRSHLTPSLRPDLARGRGRAEVGWGGYPYQVTLPHS